MAYKRLNLKDNVDKWKAEHVAHLEDGIIANENELANKQPKGDYLTEHQKIKTINGQSLVGEGDMKVGEPTDAQVASAVNAYLAENKDALDVTGGQYSVVQNDNYAVAVCDSKGNVAVSIDNDGKVRVANLEASGQIANEGSSMHHCIYTNYCGHLKNKRMIAFHVVNEDGDFTCSFRICKDDIVFDQAYKAWNKRLTDSEMQFAKSLEEYVVELVSLNPTKEDNNLPWIL